ncbi:hypothetical protein G7Z17_g2287 [Cylindrodendrum hubeiense]|uniref:Methyltransferase n=1 Tax=Cylindrodendrum hubeiense TaxID=595255 RepID=A0A9P5HD40_9HYPO|nr:hypothetical protein G7Z17_g2287 [Cylindrodendrum hubeiense]
MATVNPDPIVEPDDEVLDDQASSLGYDTASSAQSLASSIVDYRRENGRTYHRYSEGKYSLPNDDIENERLDLQHHLFLLTFDNKLGLAPPNQADSKVERVLDVGTGTGIWALDYGDEHPEAEVIGVDLSPIQPSFVPPNVKFYIDDIEAPWAYPKPFNYIHCRMMTSSLASWPNFLRDAFNNLAPGGYTELQEIDLFAKSDDDTLKDGSALAKCTKLLNDACNILGRPFQDNSKLKDIMAKIGYVDIVVTTFKWPTNAWARDKKHKELGMWNSENMSTGLEALTMAPFTRALGWSKEDVDVFLVDVMEDLNNKAVHAYWPV